jgi:hypothetical protein
MTGDVPCPLREPEAPAGVPACPEVVSGQFWFDVSSLSPAAAAEQQWQELAPALAARGMMRLSYDGARTYPRKLERVLSARLPPVPAAVYLYDDHGEARVLAADFDVGRAAKRGAIDPAGQVTADAAALAALIRSCGGRGFADISPNAGRHGYVLWAAAVPYAEMRRVALALALRYPSLDPSPLLGLRDGIIRPPGSRHKAGGFQELTTSAADARRAIRHPNGPRVWERLCTALRAELEVIDRGDSPVPDPARETAPGAQKRRDDAGAPWLPRLGGRIPRLRADLELTASTGAYDTSRYGSGSEARQAVLSSAAARGWRLSEVTQRIQDRSWPGLAGLYDRYRPRQRTRELAADWRKAVALAAGGKSSRACHTRENAHTGAPGFRVRLAVFSAVSEYQQIRQWDCAYRSAECRRWPGSHGITIRLVIRGLAAAAQMSGSTTIEFGTRSLGMLACLDHSTVARVLRELRDEDDPFIVLLRPGRRERADLYELRIPDSCSEAAAWRRWRPGLIGVHPVFRVLGGAAALVCEQLLGEPVRTVDLPHLTGLSATAVGTALADLAACGVAARGPGGWRRGPASLDDVADRLGVPELLVGLQARHRRERQIWRGILMHVSATPIAVGNEEIPWPEAPADEGQYGELAAARAPPGSDVPAAIAALEAEFGRVRVISAA